MRHLLLLPCTSAPLAWMPDVEFCLVGCWTFCISVNLELGSGDAGVLPGNGAFQRSLFWLGRCPGWGSNYALWSQALPESSAYTLRTKGLWSGHQEPAVCWSVVPSKADASSPAPEHALPGRRWPVLHGARGQPAFCLYSSCLSDTPSLATWPPDFHSGVRPRPWKPPRGSELGQV